MRNSTLYIRPAYRHCNWQLDNVWNSYLTVFYSYGGIGRIKPLSKRQGRRSFGRNIGGSNAYVHVLNKKED